MDPLKLSRIDVTTLTSLTMYIVHFSILYIHQKDMFLILFVKTFFIFLASHS